MRGEIKPLRWEPHGVLGEADGPASRANSTHGIKNIKNYLEVP